MRPELAVLAVAPADACAGDKSPHGRGRRGRGRRLKKLATRTLGFGTRSRGRHDCLLRLHHERPRGLCGCSGGSFPAGVTASAVMRLIVAPAAWLGQSWTLGKDQSLSREGEGAGNGCRAGGDCSLSGLVLGLSHSRVLLLAVPLLDLRQADFQVREIGARRGRSPKGPATFKPESPKGPATFSSEGARRSPKGPATFTEGPSAEGGQPLFRPGTGQIAPMLDRLDHHRDGSVDVRPAEGAEPEGASHFQEPEGASHFHAEGPRRGASHFSDWVLDK